MSHISSLINLGPVMEKMLAEVGIENANALQKIGAWEAWCRLKHFSPKRINRIGLYALEGALLNCHWNKLPSATKKRLDKLVEKALKEHLCT